MREYTPTDHEKAAVIAAWICNITFLQVQITAEEVLAKCRDRQELDRYYENIGRKKQCT